MTVNSMHGETILHVYLGIHMLWFLMGCAADSGSAKCGSAGNLVRGNSGWRALQMLRRCTLFIAISALETSGG